MTVSEALQVFDMTEKSIPDLDPIGMQSLIMNNNSFIMKTVSEREKQKARHENEALETLIRATKEYKYEQECAEKIKEKVKIFITNRQESNLFAYRLRVYKREG